MQHLRVAFSASSKHGRFLDFYRTEIRNGSFMQSRAEPFAVGRVTPHPRTANTPLPGYPDRFAGDAIPKRRYPAYHVNGCHGERTLKEPGDQRSLSWDSEHERPWLSLTGKLPQTQQRLERP
eukprot:1349793-Rhodomonas_salina.4